MYTKVGEMHIAKTWYQCGVSVYPPCKRCHTGWGKGSRMNIPEKGRKREGWGREAVSSQRTYIWRVASAVLTSQRSQWSDWSPSSHGHWAQVLEQCWNRGGREKCPVLFTSGLVCGGRCSVYFRAGHQCVLSGFYLTDGADATQRARAECRFIFLWKHFTTGLRWIQNRNLDSAWH